MAWFLSSLTPANGATGVSTGIHPSGSVQAAFGNDILDSSYQLRINGALVYSAGAFQAGYGGTINFYNSPSTLGLDFAVNTHPPFVHGLITVAHSGTSAMTGADGVSHTFTTVAAAPLAITSSTPSAAATGVAVGASITFVATGPDFDPDMVTIKVGGVTVWTNAGGFAAGYGGTVDFPITYVVIGTGTYPLLEECDVTITHPNFAYDTAIAVEIDHGIETASFSFTTIVHGIFVITDSDPIDGATDVAIDSAPVTFSFRAFPTDSHVDQTTVRITVGGVLAYTFAGGFETGFAGTVVYNDPPDAVSVDVTISAHPDFAYFEHVVVEVSGKTSVGAFDSSASFSFRSIHADLVMNDVLAIRENVIRIEFSEAVRYTGLLEPSDASRPEKWDVVAVEGTVGLTGDPARPVSVVRVDRPGVADGVEPIDLGRFIDLVLDRPMTPWPAGYAVSWDEVYSADLEVLSTGSAEVQAVYRLVSPPSFDSQRDSLDFANPQTTGGAAESLPRPGRSSLGTFGVDSTGDYATDRGNSNMKKRVVRRLQTRKNAFPHLPGYGVGLPDAAKQLAKPSYLAALRADAEAQVLREPDVAQARVVLVRSSSEPSLAKFQVFIKPKVGQPLAFEVPTTIE